jgi:hypothetical protein
MAGLIVTGGIALLIAVAIHLTCTQHDRPPYRVPFFPYIPAASLLLNCFLMASLPARAYWQLGIYFFVVTVFYLLYSVHAANRFEQDRPQLSVEPHKDIESTVPSATAAAADDVGHVGPTSGIVHAAPSFTRSSSLIDRINSGPTASQASVLGRRSAGVTRLPPPTL